MTFAPVTKMPEPGRASVVNDLASKDDSLGFSTYVEAITDFLTSPDTQPPLTLAVQGEWGSGKTSFMLQLQAAIRKKKKSLVVWFNPWRHDNEEAVWAAFALQFVHDIKHQIWFWQRWIGNLKLLYHRYSWEQGWIDLARKLLIWLLALGLTLWVGYVAIVNRGIWSEQIKNLAPVLLKITGTEDLLNWGMTGGGLLAYLALLFSILNRLEAVVGDPFKIDLRQHLNTPDYGQRVSFVERFHRDFKYIVEAYAGPQTVYVFIDDMDRCEATKAADLMSALNLMISDDVRIVFIIGMDEEKVAAGLAVKYEDILPYLTSELNHPEDIHWAGLHYGYEFIRKFIQLSFLLPHPDEQSLETFLRKLFQPLVKKSFWEAWRDRFKRPSEPTLPEKPATAIDTEHILEIMRQIAPAFRYNPRLIKQYLNLLRLQTYIADKTGLFNQQGEHPLTQQQFSKFIAINQMWHDLVADMDAHPNLLASLQTLALSPESQVPASPELDRWRLRSDLMEFLYLGCRDPKGGSSPEAEAAWSLAYVNTTELLRVSSQVRKVAAVEDVKSAESSSAEASTSAESSDQARSSEVLTSKVMVLAFNPILKSAGQKSQDLISSRGWTNPAQLVQDFCLDLQEASHNLLNIQIVNQVEIDDWPVLTDGFRYDWNSYQDVLDGKTPAHTPAQIDYQEILGHYDILKQVDEGQIDEVWIFPPPRLSMYESVMGGSEAFWCNAPPLLVETRRRFILMGFSYERGLGEMLEAYGHRAESILENAFQGQPGKTNLWHQYLQYDKSFPGQANVGSLHFAPNSEKDYDWANMRQVPSNCQDWYNYPKFQKQVRLVDASEWGGGDMRLHHLWWFKHLPHVGGVSNQISNNWWCYIADPNNVRLMPIQKAY